MSYNITQEFEILKKSNPRAVILEFQKQIEDLVEAFMNSGQSGGSAPFVAGAIRDSVYKLCMQKPLAGIEGKDEEWMEISNKKFQNKRLSSVFKDENGKPYYLDAISWKTPNGNTWSGPAKMSSGKTILSRQYIKSFPFVPKEFTIDVTEKEISPDNWEFTVKDEKQLEEVWKYYDIFIKNEK